MKQILLFQLLLLFVFSPYLFGAKKVHETIYVDAKGEDIKLTIEENDGRYSFVAEEFEPEEWEWDSQMYPTYINRVSYLGNLDYIHYEYKIINLSNYSDPEQYYDSKVMNDGKSNTNYFSIITYQEDNSRFNYFFRYEYSEELEEVYLQGIYYYDRNFSIDCNSFAISKLNIDLEKLPFFYLKNLKRKEVSYFIIKYLYSHYSNDEYVYTLPLSKELVRVDYPDDIDECNIALYREEYKPKLDEKFLPILDRTRYGYYDDKISDPDENMLSCPISGEMVFSCELENKKYISLCETENSYQYLYGSNIDVELSYPESSGAKSPSPKGIKYSRNKDKFNFLFNIGQYQYNLSGEKYFSKPDYGKYVLSVTRGEDTVFEQYCVRSYVNLDK